ncbi:MAG: DUF1460 domain-containing protein [Tannerella sp.]|nr:DUF1460 domain-containing protein [Tannerella sp.]
MILFLILLFAGNGAGQVAAPPADYTAEDQVIFDRYLHAMETKKTLPLGELVIETARFFLGTPYTVSTLEKEPEKLVVNLREMDCTTFVETVITLARTVREADPSFESFCRNIQRVRYREGVIHDYTDRLHYFSDWIYENERKGWVRDMTRTIGGKPYQPDISFMSTHPESYPLLKSHPERLRVIREKEREITERKANAFIPEASVTNSGEEMQNGDIVCFVTAIKGLDISHVGFICRQDGALHFIHASSASRKVIVEPRPLHIYVENIRLTTGIMIVRPQ